MKITLIKPGLGTSITGYNLSDGSMEPLQLAVIAGLIKKPDEVIMYDDRLEQIPFDEPTDLVCITVDTFCARRAYEISLKYKSRDVNVVLGGIHVSLMPEEAIDNADAIVIGDVEPVWAELIRDAKKNKLKRRYFAPFGIPQDGTFPDREIYKNKNYLPVSLMQFSRGCRFSCTFCSVSRFFKGSHVCRRTEDVLAEIEKDKLKTILFVDDNLTQNKSELKIFLKELIPLKVKWASQSGIDMVHDQELLKLMADSGCVGNLIGFESINVNSLKWFKKSPNIRDFNTYRDALAILSDHGFLTWASFVIGNDFDTVETIDKTVEFAIKNKFALAYFHILMPYPGTKIYDQFKRDDRLLYDGKWWLHPDYKYNQATFIPKLMSVQQLYEATIKANKDFYSISSIGKRAFDPKTNIRNVLNFMIYSRFNYVLRKTSI
ncbi:B12-binding domain-containing radical SAM protein [Saccharicrinis sp. FJH62]|uniref:B12-binding domain-containing radical SAM protein n=1 Tax=Saccharicrinis sp. FJH62 TaxID=3344657 RepID=UPI0035D40F19